MAATDAIMLDQSATRSEQFSEQSEEINSAIALSNSF